MRTYPLLHFAIIALALTQVYSELTILNPPDLIKWWDANPQVTKTSIATFGYIPWGRKIMGTLRLANPETGCDYIRQDDNDFLKHQILVVSRGDCPFVTKAHYAQLAGAKMLVVVDTTYEEVEKHLMVDAMGQGESVSIPAVLISKQAGDKLIQSLKNADPSISTISIVYDFELPKADNVEYHIWLSSATSQSFKFLNEWKTYDQKLNKYAKMIPHYAHFSAPGQESALANSPDCLCGGKYCSSDPDDDRSNTGVDVLLEDLRQLCIYKNYPTETWWNYIKNYDSFCLTGGDMTLCGKNTILELGLDYDSIQKCVNYSFDNTDLKQCTRNKEFDEQKKYMAEDGVFLFPSVIINGFAYRGNLLPPQGVFEAICETFNEMPGVCRHYLHITNTQPSHAPIVISALIFLALFTMFVFCCYRRYIKREMYKQMVRDVNIAVSQYIAFKDESITEEKNEGVDLNSKQ